MVVLLAPITYGTKIFLRTGVGLLHLRQLPPQLHPHLQPRLQVLHLILTCILALFSWLQPARGLHRALRPNGLHVYSVDSSGNLTYVDHDDPNPSIPPHQKAIKSVWGDGSFIYLTASRNDNGALYTYSIDSSGNLTLIDSDEVYDSAGGTGYGSSVWGDGDFIYLANGVNGLRTYSVDNSGLLTYMATVIPDGEVRKVWGDGNFIYVACGPTPYLGLNDGGLHTYSVDSSGNLTHIDYDNRDGAQGLWGDGNFIYLANGYDGLLTYSVDSSGNLTHLDSHDYGGSASDVWGDENFIYLANGIPGSGDGGLRVYSVDGSGKPDTHRPS